MNKVFLFLVVAIGVVFSLDESPVLLTSTIFSSSEPDRPFTSIEDLSLDLSHPASNSQSQQQQPKPQQTSFSQYKTQDEFLQAALSPTAVWVEYPEPVSYTTTSRQPRGKIRINKAPVVRVNDLDSLLFTGLDDLTTYEIQEMQTETVSREYLKETLYIALGADWADMVTLPEEDLTVLEFLRLSASLNEGRIHESQHVRAPADSQIGTCFCHGTAKSLATTGTPGGGHFWKDYPFKGVRLFRKGTPSHVPNGHNKQHNDMPYLNRDCLLVENTPHSCCFGFCVIDDGLSTPSGVGDLLDCSDDPGNADPCASQFSPSPSPSPSFSPSPTPVSSPSPSPSFSPSPVPSSSPSPSPTPTPICLINELCTCLDFAEYFNNVDSSCLDCDDRSCTCAEAVDIYCGDDCASVITSFGGEDDVHSQGGACASATCSELYGYMTGSTQEACSDCETYMQGIDLVENGAT